MSIIEDIGALVRAAADDLPADQVARALDHLQKAGDRLRWVRQESANPMGVPELSAATEHAESAGYALRLAQEQLAEYLAAIGLGQDGGRPPAPVPSGERRRPEPEPEPGGPQKSAPAGPAAVHRWWSERVGELTGRADESDPGTEKGATDAGDLLRRVAAGVRSGDKERLHRELRGVDASVGLGLAASAPPVLRDLATDLLGHPPRAQDLDRLRNAFDGPLRALLPNLPKPVLETVLTRVCRMPPPRTDPDAPPTNPADPAVAAGVLTGLLLQRLGRDPESVLPKDGAPPPGQATPTQPGPAKPPPPGPPKPARPGPARKPPPPKADAPRVWPRGGDRTGGGSGG